MVLTAPRMGEMIHKSMVAPCRSREIILTITSDPTYPDTKPGGFNGHDCGTIQPGSVISTSYGGDELFNTAAYMIRQCNE
jgi:hypothetical protein